MRAHPLPEARSYAAADARRAAQGHPVVPHPRRPPRPRRRVERVPRGDPRRHRRRSSHRIFGDDEPEPAPGGHAHRLRPRRRGQGARRDLLPAHAPARGPGARRGCARLGADERVALLRAYVGERANRRHKPGRAFERTDYRFDVLADYGAFRDLQRHRMLTIEWQPLSPAARLRGSRAGRRSRAARARSTTRWSVRPRCYDALRDPFPEQASYAVSLAYRLRFVDADERARGDAPARAAHLAAGPPDVPPRRAGDAPPDRRAGRPPRDRGGDALRRPRRRTSSSASPPSAPPRPGAPPTRDRCDRAAAGGRRKNFAAALTSIDARRCRSRRSRARRLRLTRTPSVGRTT